MSEVRIVEALSVEDYLHRYYKKDKFTPSLIESYLIEYECFGYVCTSERDNITGEFIAWPYYSVADPPEAIERFQAMKDVQAGRNRSLRTKPSSLKPKPNPEPTVNLDLFDT